MLSATNVISLGLQGSLLSGLNVANPLYTTVLAGAQATNFLANWRARPEGGYQLPAQAGDTLSIGTAQSNNAANPTSLTISAVTVTAGQLLLVGACWRDIGTLASVIFGAHAAVPIITLVAGNNATAAIWAVHGTLAQTADVVFTWNGATAGAIVGVLPFSGAETSYSIGNIVTATGTTTDPTIDISVSSGEVAFNLVSVDRATTLTVDAGETQQWNASDGGDFDVMGGASTTTSTGTQTMNWTASGKQNWASIALIIQPKKAKAAVSLDTRWRRQFKAPDDTIIPMPFKNPGLATGDTNEEQALTDIILQQKDADDLTLAHFYYADLSQLEDAAPEPDRYPFEYLDHTTFESPEAIYLDEFELNEDFTPPVEDILEEGFSEFYEEDQFIPVLDEEGIADEEFFVDSSVLLLLEEVQEAFGQEDHQVTDDEFFVDASIDFVQQEDWIDANDFAEAPFEDDGIAPSSQGDDEYLEEEDFGFLYFYTELEVGEEPVVVEEPGFVDHVYAAFEDEVDMSISILANADVITPDDVVVSAENVHFYGLVANPGQLMTKT